MSTTCLFSELDPFTGEIPFQTSQLEMLTNSLKLACLLYDRVIVNSNVLLEHPLCLPAFQKLKPFVQSGVLWTTNSRPQDSMEQFIQIQAGRVLREANRIRAEQVKKMLEAWLALAPGQWPMTRNASQQVGSATHNILHNLQTLKLFAPSGTQGLHRMLDKVQAMQEEQRFAREELFALLNSQRGTLHTWDRARMAMVVQGEYISQGTQNKGAAKISLFGGRFAQRMHHQQRLFAAGMPLLDFHTKVAISNALQSAGYPLVRILSLPVDALFDFSQSPEWKQWRQSVLGLLAKSKPPSFPTTLQYFFTHPKPYPVWNGILPPDAALSAQLLAQSPWLFASLATLGSLTLETGTPPTNQAERAASCPLLALGNPSILSWIQGDSPQQITISHKESALLAALAFFGEDGAPLEALRQLDMDITPTDNDLPHWQAWQDEPPEAQLARLNRINVLKHRLNARTHESGLQISVHKRKSIWRLEWQGEPTVLPITGTAWAMEKPDGEMAVDQASLPQNLTTRQQKAFRVLLEYAPSFVSAASLAEAIGEPGTSTKKVSDMLYRMNQRLAGNFSITRNHKGEYGLLPIDN